MRTAIVRIRAQADRRAEGAMGAAELDIDGRREAIRRLRRDLDEDAVRVVELLRSAHYYTEHAHHKEIKRYRTGGFAALADTHLTNAVIDFAPLAFSRSYAVVSSDDILVHLGELPEVETIHPNFTYALPHLAASRAGDQAPPWYFDRLGVLNAWRSFPREPRRRAGRPVPPPRPGAGVPVALIDTGIEMSHSEFAGRRLHGRITFDAQGHPVSGASMRDVDGNGTRVAGLICGNTLGVAPEINLHVAQIAQPGGATFAQISQGIEWAATQGVDIIHLGFGNPGYASGCEQAVERAASFGITVVAPIGDVGPGQYLSPADYAEVIAAGATDRQDRPWAQSGGGQVDDGRATYQKPDLYAPGVDIPTATLGGGYALASGTVLASALVAGIAALVRQAHPPLRGAGLLQRLHDTGTPVNAPEGPSVIISAVGAV